MREDETDVSPTRKRRPLPVLTWLRLVRVVQKISRVGVIPLQEADLTGPQFDLLTQIYLREGVTQQELADESGVTRGNISQLISKLEDRGLLLRQKEGRENHLYLTQTGQLLVNTMLPDHDRAISELLGVLTHDEQRQLLALLRKLDRGLPE